ncbi:hypothetical protein V6x_46380 [Gimesia chilikensis]|uniref:Uncharacterized protein n=1 Tax=Gimesia chilikensis TaxID=2605989 RepID=A0A517WI24_9PLAN|nr:hypothetical protein [Gimesia chilikensis]QDU04907.1 hypothetical protein V6x_46380 [Gimesia chilikensis]
MNSVEVEAGDSGEALRTEEGELQQSEVLNQDLEKSAAPIFETEDPDQASYLSQQIERESRRMLLVSLIIGLFMIGIGVAGYAQYSLFSGNWQNGVLEIQKEETVKDFRVKNYDYYVKHGRKRPVGDEFWATQSRIESLESRQEANRDRRSEYLVIRTVGLVILVVAIILALIMFLASRSPQPGPQPE